jgi:hypothetical protein
VNFITFTYASNNAFIDIDIRIIFARIASILILILLTARNLTMDPISVLSLASNVVQFVTFAKDLISDSIEIYRSTSGTTTDILNLDAIYGHLSGFSEALQSCFERESKFGAPEDIAGTVKAVKKLSISCKADCERLLDITSKLKAVPDSKKSWKSFKIALRKFWEQTEISQLEDRLAKSQVTLTLYVCTILKYDFFPFLPLFLYMQLLISSLQPPTRKMRSKNRRVEKGRYSATIGSFRQTTTNCGFAVALRYTSKEGTSSTHAESI